MYGDGERADRPVAFCGRFTKAQRFSFYIISGYLHIDKYITNIFKERELQRGRTIRNFRIDQQEGSRSVEQSFSQKAKSGLLQKSAVRHILFGKNERDSRG